jgi:acyl-CoA thioesterase-1
MRCFLFCATLLAGLATAAQASGDHVCEYNAAYINEKAKLWPRVHVAGKVMNVNQAKQRFDFVKNAVYDKAADQGRARHCVHWSRQTTFRQRAEIKNFNDLTHPVVAVFEPANGKQANKAANGRAFAAKKATLLPDRKDAASLATSPKKIAGVLMADSPKSGTLKVDGQELDVKLTGRRPAIHVEKTFDPANLADGFWKARVHGREQAGRFVAKRVILSARPDPTAGDDPDLPRVLIIGDSISMNYNNALHDALEGVANVHRIEGNAFSSNYGMQYAEYWLGNFRKDGMGWDVIQFNHGLHDLKQRGPDAPYATDLKTYQRNLRRIIATLKKTDATLIWCTTTPVPNSRGGRYGRQKGAEVPFNKAAMQVIRQHSDIQVTDLCEVVKTSAVFDRFWKGSDVHYHSNAARKALGQAVAKGIKRALDSRR